MDFEINSLDHKSIIFSMNCSGGGVFVSDRFIAMDDEETKADMNTIVRKCRDLGARVARAYVLDVYKNHNISIKEIRQISRDNGEHYAVVHVSGSDVTPDILDELRDVMKTLFSEVVDSNDLLDPSAAVLKHGRDFSDKEFIKKSADSFLAVNGGKGLSNGFGIVFDYDKAESVLICSKTKDKKVNDFVSDDFSYEGAFNGYKVDDKSVEIFIESFGAKQKKAFKIFDTSILESIHRMSSYHPIVKVSGSTTQDDKKKTVYVIKQIEEV